MLVLGGRLLVAFFRSAAIALLVLGPDLGEHVLAVKQLSAVRLVNADLQIPSQRLATQLVRVGERSNLPQRA